MRKTKIRIVEGDIAKLKVDAIVNAAGAVGHFLETDPDAFDEIIFAPFGKENLGIYKKIFRSGG